MSRWNLLSRMSRMSRMSLLSLLVMVSAVAADLPGLPLLPAGTWECHGTVQLRGQTAPERFWLRLLPPDKEFAGNRVLQIVYTPPPQAALGGTHLADVPFVLLDSHSRIMAWNDRNGMSQMTPGKAGSATYVVSRDRTPTDHTEIVADERIIPGERAWDRTVAPLLLALVWRAGQEVSLPCVDLFADEPASTVSWLGPAVACHGQTLQVEADAGGRVHRVVDAQGTPVLVVTAWLQEGVVHAEP